jgi:hypothetical protein
MSLGWPFFEMEWNPTTRKVEQEHNMQYLFLAPYALLLNHHPLLQNVQPSAPLWTSSITNDEPPLKEPIVLTATQPIQAGQELYLDFAQHVHSIEPQLLLHNKLPTIHHYQEADEIIQDARTTFKAKNFIAKKRQYEIGMGLRMMTKVVARYQPIVASLLPTLVDTLLNFNYEHKGSTSALIMMHNQTKISLGTFGACMSDLGPDSSSQTTTTRTTTRSVLAGQRVHPMPLYIRNKRISDWSCKDKDDDQDQDETCTAFYETKGTCLSTTDLPVEICPLQGQVAEIASSPDEANVAYRWSAWKQAVNGTLKSPDVIVKVRSDSNTMNRWINGWMRRILKTLPRSSSTVVVCVLLCCFSLLLLLSSCCMVELSYGSLVGFGSAQGSGTRRKADSGARTRFDHGTVVDSKGFGSKQVENHYPRRVLGS